ncbi:MAG: hypothetical protein QXV37_01450 [Candidatus Jordarchaeaceae archaeon]
MMANLLRRKWEEQSFKDKLFWMKNLFATVGAIVSTIIRPIIYSPLVDSPFMSNPHPALTAAVVGVLLLVGLSTFVSYHFLKITPDQVNGWRTYLTTGLLSALCLWLVIWTILYETILYSSPLQISIMDIFQISQFFLLLKLFNLL